MTVCDKFIGVQIIGLEEYDKIKWPDKTIP